MDTETQGPYIMSFIMVINKCLHTVLKREADYTCLSMVLRGPFQYILINAHHPISRVSYRILVCVCVCVCGGGGGGGGRVHQRNVGSPEGTLPTEIFGLIIFSFPTPV